MLKSIRSQTNVHYLCRKQREPITNYIVSFRLDRSSDTFLAFSLDRSNCGFERSLLTTQTEF